MSAPPLTAAAAPSGQLCTLTVVHGSDRLDKGEMPGVSIYASPQTALAAVLDDFAPELAAYADEHGGETPTDEAGAAKTLREVGIYVEILAQAVMP